jgi:hypothetical protein
MAPFATIILTPLVSIVYTFSLLVLPFQSLWWVAEPSIWFILFMFQLLSYTIITITHIAIPMVVALTSLSIIMVFSATNYQHPLWMVIYLMMIPFLFAFC